MFTPDSRYGPMSHYGVGGYAHHAIYVAILSSLGAGPAGADTRIDPDGSTATNVDRNGSSTTVTTDTTQGDNAFNSFNHFRVAKGHEANLKLPDSTSRLINLVHDSRAVVDGTVNSLKDGAIGGDVIFADPHGFLVGNAGTLNVGSLGVATPNARFMDRIIGPDGPDAGAVDDLLSGDFEVADGAEIRIDGEVNAADGVRLLAGKVTVSGEVDVADAGDSDTEAAAVFDAAVNTEDLARGGSIDTEGADVVIAASGDAGVDGRIAADGPDGGGDGGTVVVSAGDTAAVGDDADIDVSGRGADADGGTIAVWGDASARLADGARVHADAGGRGDGDGGLIEVSADREVRVGSADLRARASGEGADGEFVVDPDIITVGGTESADNPVGARHDFNGLDVTFEASDRITLAADAVINTRTTDGGADEGSKRDTRSTASTGDSGAITLEAPTIELKGSADGSSGAQLLTFATGSHAAGDVTLDADQSFVSVTPTAEIDVQEGARIDAGNADGGAGGPISLVAEARDDQLSGYAESTADVTVAGDLTGASIEARALVEASVGLESPGDIEDIDIQDLGDDIEDTIEEGFDLTDLSNVAVAGSAINAMVSVARANADVTIESPAELDAAGEVDLAADAKRRADTTRPSDPTEKLTPVGPAAVSYGQLQGTASVTVAEGAAVEGGDVSARATSTDQLNVAASSEVERPAPTDSGSESGSSRPPGVGGALAVGYTDTSTSVNIAGDITATGATSETSGDVAVSARHDAKYATSANYTIVGGDAAAGLTGAVASLNDDTKAVVAGTVDAAGDVTVTADTAVAGNSVAANTKTGSTDYDYASGPVSGASRYLEHMVSSVTGRQGSQDSNTQNNNQDNSNQEQGGADVQMRFGAAGAINLTDFDATARIADGAKADDTDVAADGNLAVQARVRDAGIRNIAVNSTNSASRNENGARFTLSTAVTVGNYQHEADAVIDHGVHVEAENVGVGARTQLPITPSGVYAWGDKDWDNARDVIDRLREAYNTDKTTLGLPNGLLTSYTNATGSAQDLALAGAVNYFGAEQNATARIGEGAEVHASGGAGNTWESTVKPKLPEADNPVWKAGDASKWEWGSGIDVDARATTESLNFVGNLAALSASGTSAEGGTAVGGALGWTDFRNTVRAGVGDGAWLDAAAVSIDAESADQLVNVGPSAGRGSSVAVNGVLLLSRLDNRTRAALSNTARVDAADGGLAVNADQELSVWTLAGAANMSSDSGVGAALGFNWIDTDTDASIGAVEIDADDDAGDASLCGTDLPRECGVYASSLALGGRTGGRVGSLGVAGALTRSQKRSSDNGSKSNLGDNSSSAGSNTGGQTPSQQQTSGWESLQNAGGSVNSYIDLLTAKETTDGNEQAPSQDTLKKRFNDKFRGNDGKLSGEAGGENSDNSGGQSKPEFGLTASGSAAANVTLLDTSAYAEDATLEIGGPVDVEAHRHTGLFAGGGGAAVRAGGGSTGSRSVAVAGALGMNVLDNNTRAYMDGTALDVTDGSDVSVQALSGGVSGAVGLGLAVNTQSNSLASAAGSASVTVGLNETAAYLEDTTVDASGGDLAVTAYDHVNIASGGGGLYAGGKAGLGAAISFTLLDNETRAYVDGGLVTGITDADVQARSPARILAGAAMGGYADSEQKVGLAGSFVINLIDNTTAAEVSGDQGDPVIEADGDVSIQASGADDERLEDALGLGAIDAPFDFAGEAIPDLEYTLGNTDAAKDKLSDASGVNDDAMPTIAAPTTGQDAGAAIISVAGMAQAGQADAALGLAGLFNGVSSDYTAAVDAATIRADGQIDVDATNNTRITSLAAGLSAQKGQFVGTGSFAANVIDGATTARVADSHITGRAGSGTATGGLAVNASDSREIWSAAGSVAVSQGGTSAGGALGVNLAMGSVDAELTGTSVRASGIDVDATSKTGLATGAVAASATSGSVAVTGSLDLNLDFGRTRARVEDSDLTLSDDGPLDVTALDESVIWGLAGGVSAAKGTAAVGASGAVNVTAHGIDAALLDTGLDAEGSAVEVDAARGGSIVGGAVGAAAGGSIAGGVAVSANVVADQVRARTTGLHGVADDTAATAASLGVDAGHEATILSLGGQAAIGKSAGVGGGVTANWSDATVAATLEDADLAVPGATDVTAGTTGFIGSFAFGFGAGKTAALGAALTFNGLRNDVEAAIVDSGQSSVDNTVTVRATDAATIWSGAVAGAGAKGAAGGLAVGGNYIGSSVEAGIHGPGDGSTGTPWLASDVLVDADAGGEINTAAIGASASGGLAASGSLVANVMEGETLATIDSGADVRALGDVGVLARATQEARTFAGAGAFSLGFGAVGISAATNVLNDTTAARIDGDATRVTALGLDTGYTLTVPTGETANSAAMASALETDDTDGDDENERFEKQQAALRDSLTDFSFDPETEAMRGVSVNAVSLQKTQTAGVAVAASLDPTSIVKLIGGAIGSVGTGGTSMPAAYLSSGAGAAANVGVNVFGGETRASIDGARINQDGVDGETTAAADQQVDVTAASHGVVGNLSAALSGGSVAAAAGAFAVNVSERETAAMIRDSRVDAAGAVTVDALGSEAFGSLAGGISGALLGLGPVGTSVANVIDTTTTAGVTGGTITAGQLDIHADHRALVSTAAGSVGLGTIAGAAGAVTVNLAESTTRAWLGDDPTTSGSAESTDLYVPGSVDVAADSGSGFTNFVASVAAGGALGGAGATTVNQIADVTRASAGNVDFRERASAFSVGADGEHGITTLVGAAGAAAGVGAGAAVGVNLLRTSTIAAVTDSGVDADTFSVTADSHRTIDNVATGFAGGSFGLAGGVGVTVVGDSDPGSGDGERSEAWGGTASARESADTNLDMVEDNSGADVAATGPGSDGVSARVSGGSVSAGSVSVEAVSTTDIERNKSGAAAGGVTGVGAGVAVAQVAGNITARFEPTTATVDGDISVEAQGHGDQEAEAYAGSAGVAAAIGAAIADSRSDNVIEASLGGSVNVHGAVTVDADDTTSITTGTYGAQAGATTTGVSVSTAVAGGSVTAGLDDSAVISGSGDAHATGLKVTADANGAVSADGVAAAAGIVSGTGVAATAEDDRSAKVVMADGAEAHADSVGFTAEREPDIDAEASGGALGAAASAGASVADAVNGGSITAELNGTIDGAETLTLHARQSTDDAGETARSRAIAANAGAYLGANAAAATTEATGDVTAEVGASAELDVADRIDVHADRDAGLEAGASGWVAGALATGAAVAQTTASGLTEAGFGGSTVDTAAARFRLRATDTTDSFAGAMSGSGGLVSAAAASGLVSDSRGARASLGGDASINADWVTIEARRTSRFFPGADAKQATLAGYSGAFVRRDIDATARVEIADGGAGIDSYMTELIADAIVREGSDLGVDVGPADFDYNVDVVSGGVVTGQQGSNASEVDQTSAVDVGEGTDIVAVRAPAGWRVPSAWQGEFVPGVLTVLATGDLRVSDNAYLAAGGAMPNPWSETELDVTGSTDVSVGADADLYAGDLLGVSAYNRVLEATASATAKSWGAVSIAGTDSRVDLDYDQSVSVGSSARLESLGNLLLTAGRRADIDSTVSESRFTVSALAETYNYTAAPLETEATGTADVAIDATTSLDAGSVVNAGLDVTAGAFTGDTFVTGKGTEHNPYLEAFSTQNTSRDRRVSTTESIAIDGIVTAGFLHDWDISIDDSGDWADTTLNGRSLADIDSRLVPDDPVSGPLDFNPQSFVQGLQDDLSDLDESYRRFADQIDTAGLPEDARRFRVSGLRATQGNVRVHGGELSGNGTLEARGGAEIDIDNPSDAWLDVADVRVPDNPGGRVTLAGGLTDDDVSGVKLREAPDEAASIDIQVNAENRSLQQPEESAGLLVSGALTNPEGVIRLGNDNGNIYQLGVVRAATIQITAPNGSVVLISPDATAHVGGTPWSSWSHLGAGSALDGADMGEGDMGVYTAISLAMERELEDDYGGHDGDATLGDDLYDYCDTCFMEDDDGRNTGLTIAPFGVDGFEFAAGDGDPTSEVDTVPYDSAGEYTKFDRQYRHSIWREVKRTGDYRSESYDEHHGSTGAVPAIEANKVMLTADVLNINAPIKAGSSTDVDLDLGGGVVSALDGVGSGEHDVYWQRASDGYARGLNDYLRDLLDLPDESPGADWEFIGPGEDPSRGGEVIGGTFDADAGEIRIDRFQGAQTGHIVLDGEIVASSKAGELDVQNGYADIDIDNTTGYDLHLGGAATGTGAQGVIEIVDRLRDRKTWYVNRPGDQVRQYTTTDLGAGQWSGAPDATGGGGMQYSPRSGAGFRWEHHYRAEREIGNPTDGNFYAYEVTEDWEWVDSDGNTGVAGVLDGERRNEHLVTDHSGADYEWRVKDAAASKNQGVYVEFSQDDAVAGYHGGDEDSTHHYFRAPQRIDVTTETTVRADYAIDVTFSGAAETDLEVHSDADVHVDGALRNPGGEVTIDGPADGRVDGAVTAGADGVLAAESANVHARGAIGSADARLGLDLDGGVVRASSATGAVNLESPTSELTVGSVDAGGVARISAGRGLDQTSGSEPAVIGGEGVVLASDGGSILGDGRGDTRRGLFVDAGSGTVSASAVGDIELHGGSADLRIGTVRADGDVRIETGGAIASGEQFSTLDGESRTEAAERWSDLALIGDAAEEQRDSAVDRFEREVELDYERYWRLAEYVQENPDGTVELRAGDPADEAQTRYADLAAAAGHDSVAGYLATRYREARGKLRETYGTEELSNLAAFQSYDSNFDYTASSERANTLTEGAVWSEQRLYNTINEAAVSNEGGAAWIDEEVEIAGQQVELIAGGDIGARQTREFMLSVDETLASSERAALLNAAPGGVEITGDAASGFDISAETVSRLRVEAPGGISLDAADEAAVGGDRALPLDRVAVDEWVYLGAGGDITYGTADARITGMQGGVNLKSVSGSIHQGDNTPLRMALDGPLNSAIAADNVRVADTSGDFEVGLIAAPGTVEIEVPNGSLTQIQGKQFTIGGRRLALDVAGSAGAAGEPIHLAMRGTNDDDVTSGAVHGSVGGDFILDAPNQDLNLATPQRPLSTGGDFTMVESAGNVELTGDVSAVGDITLNTLADVRLRAPGGERASLTTDEGDITLFADNFYMAPDTVTTAGGRWTGDFTDDIAVARIEAGDVAGADYDLVLETEGAIDTRGSGVGLQTPGGLSLVGDEGVGTIARPTGGTDDPVRFSAARLKAVSSNGSANVRTPGDVRLSEVDAAGDVRARSTGGSLRDARIDVPGWIELRAPQGEAAAAELASGGYIDVTAQRAALDDADAATTLDVVTAGDQDHGTLAATDTLALTSTDGAADAASVTSREADVTVDAASSAIGQGDAATTLDVTTSGDQDHGTLAATDTLALTSTDGAADAASVTSREADVTVDAASSAIGQGDAATTFDVETTGDQDHGEFVSGERMALTAGGDIGFDRLRSRKGPATEDSVLRGGEDRHRYEDGRPLSEAALFVEAQGDITGGGDAVADGSVILDADAMHLGEFISRELDVGIHAQGTIRADYGEAARDMVIYAGGSLIMNSEFNYDRELSLEVGRNLFLRVVEGIDVRGIEVGNSAELISEGSITLDWITSGTGEIRLDAGGDIDITGTPPDGRGEYSVNAGTAFEAQAGGEIRLGSVDAATDVGLDAVRDIVVFDMVRTGESADFAGRSYDLDVVHAGDGMLDIDATGHDAGNAEYAGLDIDASDGVDMGDLYAVEAEMTANAELFDIDSARIPYRMRIDTDGTSILANNRDPATRPVDVQLHELDKRFRFRIDGTQVDTTAYVTRFGYGYGSRVPNFVPEHEEKETDIDGQSAVRNSLRRSVTEEAPRTRDTGMIDAGELVFDSGTGFPVNLDLAELSRRLRAAERAENRGYEL